MSGLQFAAYFAQRNKQQNINLSIQQPSLNKASRLGANSSI